MKRLAWICIGALMILSGCSAEHYRKSADQEVYEILRRKHESLYRTEAIYRIEKLARDPFESLSRAEKPILDLPEGIQLSLDLPLIVSLEKSLEIAEYNSREYQTQKEDVYLSALALTGERYQFSAQFNSLLSAFWTKTPLDESVSAAGSLDIFKLLKTGATIGINLSTEFLRFLTGDPRRTAASILAVSIVQPLWRGAGKEVVAENLKQAERDLIYQIRLFARFKMTLAVSVASSYYRVLQQRAVVRNEQRNYQTLFVARDRSEMLAEAGRVPEFQADQAKQDELRAKDRWIQAVILYFELLDRFKIALGLPTEAVVDLDESDLQELIRTGISHPDLSLEEAVSQAMVRREDLKVTEGRVADAERKIGVAINALGPSIDLVFDTLIPTQPANNPAKFRLDGVTWNAGMAVELPLNRLIERNDYRAALINLDRAVRNYNFGVDTVVLQVRDAWRTLQQTRESYDIQKSSVELAKRRVDSTTLLLQAGRADIRDLLESQAALVEAENAFVRVLADHAVARLEFYRDMGILDSSEPRFLRHEDN